MGDAGAQPLAGFFPTKKSLTYPISQGRNIRGATLINDTAAPSGELFSTATNGNMIHSDSDTDLPVDIIPL